MCLSFVQSRIWYWRVSWIISRTQLYRSVCPAAIHFTENSVILTRRRQVRSWMTFCWFWDAIFMRISLFYKFKTDHTENLISWLGCFKFLDFYLPWYYLPWYFNLPMILLFYQNNHITKNLRNFFPINRSSSP